MKIERYKNLYSDTLFTTNSKKVGNLEYRERQVKKGWNDALYLNETDGFLDLWVNMRPSLKEIKDFLRFKTEVIS